MAEVLSTGTSDLFQAAVSRATDLLRSGRLVAIPTETVYGLAANALDPEAVAKIFQVKNRPATNPIIVHVAGISMAQDCVRSWPPVADKLAAAFWPGPLTLVLPRAEKIPDIVTAGGETVGVRWPVHPFMQAVIRACGFPLAAPSANLSGQISPTTAQHVCKSLGRKIALIVDGGPCAVGIESTVLDVSLDPPRLLRPGLIHAESLLPLTGSLLMDGGESAGPVRSPGRSHRHYAPKAKLVVLNWKDAQDLKQQVANLHYSISQTYVVTHTKTVLSGEFGGGAVIAQGAEAFARAIYSELHRADESGARLIVIEELPGQIEWQAIADRLRRGAA
jgi:L-threonylcarbamoyladenylate synthase